MEKKRKLEDGSKTSEELDRDRIFLPEAEEKKDDLNDDLKERVCKISKRKHEAKNKEEEEKGNPNTIFQFFRDTNKVQGGVGQGKGF